MVTTVNFAGLNADSEETRANGLGTGIPSYMVAANNHNLGNLNTSITEPVEEQPFATRAGMFATSALYSGINSFYNTAQWAGNFFSDEGVEYRKTRDVIAEFDEDTAKYYDQNREAADLVGFIASSFVPGLGGVKVFNAGAKALTAAKEGVAGVNMARGLGILPGGRQALVKEAIEGYATSQKTFSYLDGQTLKAVANGFGEQFMQAAAFEIAVAATLKKSPILDDMSLGDIVKNIAFGAVVGGGIGGVIEGAITTGAIKRGIREADSLFKPLTARAGAVKGTSASDELIIARNDIDTTPGVEDPRFADNLETATRLRDEKVRTVDNFAREKTTAIAGGDALIGNLVHTAIRTDDSASYMGKVLGLDEIAVHSKTIPLTAKDSLEPLFAVKHLKLWGDDAGKLSDEAPAALQLGDYVPAGQKITTAADGVRGKGIGEAGSGFIPHAITDLWSPLTTTYTKAISRHAWAQGLKPFTLAKNELFKLIGEADIPLLTKAYNEGFTSIKLVSKDANGKQTIIDAPKNSDDFLAYIQSIKDQSSAALLERAMTGKAANIENSAERIAYITDTPLGYLEGGQSVENVADAIFGLKNAQKQFDAKFPEQAGTPVWSLPQNLKLKYDIAKAEVAQVDNFQVEAMAVIKERQKIQAQAQDVATTSVLGTNADLLPAINDDMLAKTNRLGSGSGFVSFTNGNYGSAGSVAEYIGGLVTKWVGEAKQNVEDIFASTNYAIANSNVLSAELSSVITKARNTGEKYLLVTDEVTGAKQLKLAAVVKYENAVAAGDELATPPVIPKGVDETIELRSPEVTDWVTKHVEVNDKRRSGYANLQGSQGIPTKFSPGEFYPPAPNPDRYTHHAFVRDERITGDAGHTTMIYADSAAGLEAQIANATSTGFKVYTKADTKEYFKARGNYDYAKGYNENQLDVALRRDGASATFNPVVGKALIEDLTNWQVRQEANLIRNAVSTKYSRQFRELHDMGERYTKLESSRPSALSRFAAEVKNPYEDYIKTALGVSRLREYPVWNAINSTIDTIGQKVYDTVGSIFRSAKSPEDLAKVDEVFKSYGLQTGALNAQLDAWVNHPAGKGAVSDFIRKQNSILSTLTLRLDPFNAINNAVGSPILTSAETNFVIGQIKKGNKEAIGELARLAEINVPGTTDSILSPAKLISNAYANFFRGDSKALMAKYEKLGIKKDLLSQFRTMIDEDLTITGVEDAGVLKQKMAAAFKKLELIGNKGAGWTGNNLAEDMNRFVSANVMDQLTSVAVKNGLMDERTAASYINTFVNRTQGNTIAAQRPLMFQGPLGQAIGLFQSYQFNFTQQLLRFVGEGSRKDAAVLLGMQATIYGANGLPGFQAINTHLLGNASGNKNHTDAYSSIYNVAGKNAGDWLTYGLASNMLIDPELKANLYSRGDINPRQLTIVPGQISEIPIIGAYTKLFGALKSGTSTIANGGDVWTGMLTAVQQQGISRPLAGLASVLQGAPDGKVSFTQTGKGNIVASNDLYSFANLVRLGGAKPFDEAVTQDAVYRVQAYSAKDATARQELGKAVKSTVIGGGVPTSEQMEQFAENYAKKGGKQEEFTGWYMQQLRAANMPQANKILSKGDTPYSKYMQTIMGGRQFATPELNPIQTAPPEDPLAQ